MIPRPIVCQLFISSALFLAAGHAAGEDASKFVLVLYPEAANGSPGGELADRGIREALNEKFRGSVEIQNEYLEASRFPEHGSQDDLARFLQRKYAGRRIDAVIAGLSTGLDYALKYRDQIFPGVPIIFCAIDEHEIKQRQIPDDVIGVPGRWDLASSLAVGLHCFPTTQRVYVVVGRSKFDSDWEAQARSIFDDYGDRVEVSYLAGLPMDELRERVSSLPDHSLIYYLHVFEDGNGKVFMPAEALDLLAENANAPIFCHVDSYIGRGAVGGRVFSFEEAGKSAGSLAARVLKGEKPEVIGIQEAATGVPRFDWRELQRWSISESRLPAGSIVEFKTPSLWEAYKWHISVLASVCVLQGLLIAVLVVERVRRTRAERRIQLALDAAPTGMLMANREGKILFANAQMRTLFGYAREEIDGKPAQMLIPARFRADYERRRQAYFAAPQIRRMGIGKQLFGQRKDGSEFPIEIVLYPLRMEKGVAVLAAVIDVTERREAEDHLRESQATLRELTRKLLSAEETERRRIARDLHDDLSQSLALLSIELDLLQQGQPQDPSQLAARLARLSTRTKQLSSSVHDLSHQLHPMKLEQLGFVAAVRGLCKELSEGHGLPIDFDNVEPTIPMPPDVSLCLFRVIQEALQNVIKHSRARHVVVEFRIHPDKAHVRIEDDGIGFDPQLAKNQNGLGLASMRERAGLVNGHVDFKQVAPRGTSVEVWIPLHGQ